MAAAAANGAAHVRTESQAGHWGLWVDFFFGRGVPSSGWRKRKPRGTPFHFVVGGAYFETHSRMGQCVFVFAVERLRVSDER